MKNKLSKLQIFSLCLVGGVFVAFAFFFLLEMQSTKRYAKRVAHTLGIVTLEKALHEHINYIPEKFSKVPFADEKGIVVSVKKVKINGVFAPYNPSIIEKKDGTGYYIFFRYDVKKGDVESHPDIGLETFIGVAELDNNFLHCSYSFRILDTHCLTAEDPRAFYFGDDLYLMFNNALEKNPEIRCMNICKVNTSVWELDNIRQLNINQQKVEKNWVPFVYNDNIHVEYVISPHRVLQINHHEKNAFDFVKTEKIPQIFDNIWEKKWGKISGGTPARLVDGKYLSFFHSRFYDGPIACYAIGAYTFENHPPFRILSITRYPIIFHGMYDTKHIHTSNKLVKCLFPSGITFSNDPKASLVHVSIGENDAGIKIITSSEIIRFYDRSRLK